MLNAAEVTREAFEPFLEMPFKLSREGGVTFEAELIEVSPMGETVGPTGRQAFAVVLRGPATEAPEQGMHRVEHSGIGSIDLFLVPIGPDDKGMKYEAVFT